METSGSGSGPRAGKVTGNPRQVNSFLSDWKMVLLLCLTLGLAPFFPEPHIVGKLKWIAGGAQGMVAMDWFDVLLHATPWILLIRVAYIKLAS